MTMSVTGPGLIKEKLYESIQNHLGFIFMVKVSLIQEGAVWKIAKVKEAPQK
jgi:hypothetical protein